MPHLWVTLQFPLSPTFSSPVAMEILSRSRMRSISIKVFTTDSDGDNPEVRNEVEERRIMKTILSGPVREHIHRCEILEINAVYPQNLPNLTSLLVLASHERLTVFELNAVERYGSAPSISYSGFKPPIFRISPFPLLSELSLDGHNFLVLMSFNPIRWFEDSGAGSGSTSDRWRRLKIHTYAHQKWHEEKPLPLLRYMPFLCKFFEVCISNLQVEVPVGPLKRLIDEEGQVDYVPRLELDHVRKDEAVAALVKHLLPDELYIKGGALKSLPLELPSKVTFVDSAVRIQDIAYLRQLLVEYEDEEMQIEFLNSREDDVDVPTLHLLGVTRFEKIERGEEREVYWRYEMEDDWGLPEELGWETDSEGAVEVAGGSLEV
ncbi:hypothetical protein H0H93_013576 [Arthromyces matolae]|nr:hypothetical protein H0H93_013576 [Arthromyces matolae]